MIEVITEEDLKKYLDRSKVVEIEDEDGGDVRKFGFRITAVPLMCWDPSNSWYSDLRASNAKAFAEKLGARVAAPTSQIMRDVLLLGIQEPKISESKGGSGIKIDDLLARSFLALRLYTAIANLSCEGLLEVREETNGPPKPTPID